MQIVSLTTDYGSKDFYVAELKASILTNKNDFSIIDISHEIDRFDIVQAAFYVQNAMTSFPEGSIHIVAVNCNYKRKSEYICFEKNNSYFIGPNNGIFSLIFDHLDESNIYQIVAPNPEQISVNAIFSHAAAYIGHGLPLSEIGNIVSVFSKKLVIQPVVTSQQIRATIIHIDHFENIVVNLKKELFDKVRNNRNFELYYKPNDPITFLSRDYGDVSIGDAVAFFNSAGYLEIALNMDKASSMLNLMKNEMIQINFYD
ncbi:MAG: SAM-dependent chlorinase/fluorinase [Saprospiraceae bacterium]|nr:SAM-dependent chlorinase/fluorinase [Saprospiraceae bacterium]MBK8668212.1 SAM-dependent chlorinase/fluorinase [Saprospiraceae bacterium]MBL0099316.1 SAM-dependent chlorinase/fluorinase [Saprospiraceae bacterium]